MSLDWNVGEVKDFETVCFNDWSEEEGGTLKGHVDHAIWLCLYIGVPGIFGKYVDKYIERVHLLKRLGYNYASYIPEGEDKSVPFYLSDEQIKELEGLHTNVSFESDAKFKNRMWKVISQEADGSEYRKVNND